MTDSSCTLKNLKQQSGDKTTMQTLFDDTKAFIMQAEKQK